MALYRIIDIIRSIMNCFCILRRDYLPAENTVPGISLLNVQRRDTQEIQNVKTIGRDRAFLLKECFGDYSTICSTI